MEKEKAPLVKEGAVTNDLQSRLNEAIRAAMANDFDTV